jgi:UDP-4-amino-4,6-dideoxy-N-acetyl-beta-L-altrosamine transaminase
MNPIPYGKHHITQEDIAAVTGALKSDYLTQGPLIEQFEKDFARYIGVKYAVALANGTAALHLCALAMGLKPGDKVITTPITFAASSNCIRYCGAEVVFCDVRGDLPLMDLDALEKLLQGAPRHTYKGVIPVDFAGAPVNLERLRSIADEHGLWIIEDACHAPGGYFTDSTGIKQFCGNGIFAELGIFSFHPVKHIASGEGGMITTNNEELYQRIKMLRTHGISRDATMFRNTIQQAGGSQDDSNYPGWYSEMLQLGYNYRITDFQAALGQSQLKRADEGLLKRLKLAERYDTYFQKNSFVRPVFRQTDGVRHAHHLYVVLAEDRLGLYNYLHQNKIYAQVHYYPTHLMPYYRQFGWREGMMENAEKYYSSCLSLPMYPTLTFEEQDFVVQTIEKFYDSK